jgi:hypothetical protein
MGIAQGALKFMFEEGKKERWKGSVLTLGKQDIAFTLDILNQESLKHSYVLNPLGKKAQAPSSLSTDKHNLSDAIFFSLLGFSHVESMDKSAYEGADIIHDLNISEPPQNSKDKYDLVLDGGTLEHVFHIPNALSCISSMVKTGGRIIHISPMSNCADHGFYSFSPTLFVDYYSLNKFSIENIVYISFQQDPCMDEWSYFSYDKSPITDLGPGVYFLMACVRKLPNSTSGSVPQQGHYVNKAWLTA